MPILSSLELYKVFFDRRFKKDSTRSWTCFHIFIRPVDFVFAGIQVGKHVVGPALKILSISHIYVSRTSSVVNWLDKRVTNIRRTLLIMRSQIPPLWPALVGVNFHLHYLLPNVRIILSWFQACKYYCTIDSVTLKFVPLRCMRISNSLV